MVYDSDNTGAAPGPTAICQAVAGDTQAMFRGK